MSKDIYSEKNLRPMTIGGPVNTLDQEDYLYELKFDGYRCPVYLDPDRESTDMRSKRNNSLSPQFPELQELHKTVKEKCVLDGELVILTKGGFPDFEELQGRSHMRNAFTIASAARKSPATLIVFDILYQSNERLMGLPLWQRKQRLTQVINSNAGGMLQESVFAQGDGSAILAFAQQHGLEGVIGKQRDSLYYPGVRTKEWFKYKLLDDDDFVICGYLDSTKTNVTTLILGQYDENGNMLDMGDVVLGRQQADYATIAAAPKAKQPPFTPSKSDEHAVWLQPELVCTVSFSYRRANGRMRHGKYKALRQDKVAQEAVYVKQK